MFEKFTSEGGGTFRQRYLNTYGFFNNRESKKPPLLVKLVEFTGNNHSTVCFEDIHGARYHLHADSTSDIGFDFAPPEKRWYPHYIYGAVLGARKPVKQYSKGLCDNNYILQYLDEKYLKFNSLEINFKEAENILQPKIKTIQLSLKEWVSSQTLPHTYYVTNQLVICKHPNGRLFVYLYDQVIATLTLAEDILIFKDVDLIFNSECIQLQKLLGFKGIIYE